MAYLGLVKQNCTSWQPQNLSGAYRNKDNNKVFDNHYKNRAFDNNPQLLLYIKRRRDPLVKVLKLIDIILSKIALID